MTKKLSPYKVILCGESAVGKTTLMAKLSGNYTGVSPEPTMSCNYCNIKTKIDEQVVDMSFWDTAGQEQYRSLVKIFFKGAEVVIYVCDLTSKISLNALDFWIKEASENVGDVTPSGLLIANKSDLVDKIEITDNDLNEFSNTHKIKVMKLSAISEDNLEFLKTEIAKICIQYQENRSSDEQIPPKNLEVINVNDSPEEKEKRQCC